MSRLQEWLIVVGAVLYLALRESPGVLGLYAVGSGVTAAVMLLLLVLAGPLTTFPSRRTRRYWQRRLPH